MKSPALAAMLAIWAGAGLAQDRTIAVDIVFDDDTSARLIEMGEWVTVSAFYYGQPGDASAPTEEDGSVWLGGESLDILPVDQTIHLGGALAAMPIGWVTEARLHVNVFTSRIMAEDNLIDCGIVEDALATLQAAPSEIRCSWLDY